VPEAKPKVILRMGSHSEKEYIQKTLKYFDGVMVGANLLQISPGATASLLFKLHGETKRPYYVDPVTYAFGSYFDPVTSKLRDDLDWIKSLQKVSGKKGVVERKFKGSYLKLADVFGPPFSTALARGVAINQNDFSDDLINLACQSVLAFQAERMREVFKQDPQTEAIAEQLPGPAALFAPYFYIEPTRSQELITLNNRLATAATKQGHKTPIHVVVCGHLELLTNRELATSVIENLLACKPAGVWLWFSRLDERYQELDELLALRWWVEQLAPAMSVFNMHGGFYSLALNKYGMVGTAHGVGYGEQKDVVPVIGQSTPTVQYYVRPLHSKYSVAQIQRSFSRLGIRTSDDFYEKICDCQICKGIIGDDLDQFSQFGEIHYSTPKSKRAAQTPAAAKRCRYHFLLNRIKEREYVAASSLGTIVKDLQDSAAKWATTAALGTSFEHLRVWASALS
jgi:hypothetical protein